MENQQHKQQGGQPRTLIYACVIVQPQERQYVVGAPLVAERSLNRAHPYLLVQGVLGSNVTSVTRVEEFRGNVSSIVEQLIKERGRNMTTLGDISARLVEAGYGAMQRTPNVALHPKTL